MCVYLCVAVNEEYCIVIYMSIITYKLTLLPFKTENTLAYTRHLKTYKNIKVQ